MHGGRCARLSSLDREEEAEVVVAPQPVQTDGRVRVISVPPVSPAVARDHLERTLGSATFSRADQLRRLLEWLAGRSLAAAPVPPSEKEIAEAVLRRRDFDPQADSLVRKEMSRLREKLMRYYQTEGAREAVRIDAGGGYLLRFTWSSEAPAVVPRARCLLLLPLRSAEPVGHRFLEDLHVALGETAPFDLVAPTTALGYVGKFGDVREFAAECGADMVAEGSLSRSGDQFEATLWLVDGRTGRTRRPGRFVETDWNRLADMAAQWLLDRIEQRGE
ncbi:MAG: hypothetical protein U0Q16_19745 [Bryobacteraceae bacterium]